MNIYDADAALLYKQEFSKSSGWRMGDLTLSLAVCTD